MTRVKTAIVACASPKKSGLEEEQNDLNTYFLICYPQLVCKVIENSS